MKRFFSIFAIALILCILLSSSKSGYIPKSGPTATVVGALSTEMNGTSTLFYWNDRLWTCEDHGKLILFALDSLTGEEVDRITLSVRVNDMEEVAQDADYLYFGDFGNNVDNQRDNLRILRCLKSDLAEGACYFDTVRFTYPDYQPGPGGDAMTTDFDCEAMIATEDSLYLFTKQWGSFKTACYSLPKEPGDYIAAPHGLLDVGGLVSGACYLPEKHLLVLCGYNSVVQPFVYLLYGFEGTDFFGGEKSKVSLSNGIGTQTEGIASLDGEHYFLTNEYFDGLGIRPAQLLALDLSEYLHDYLYPDTTQTAISEAGVPIVSLYPNPTTGKVRVSDIGGMMLRGCQVEAYDMRGSRVGECRDGVLDLSAQADGVYLVSIIATDGSRTTTTVVKQ